MSATQEQIDDQLDASQGEETVEDQNLDGSASEPATGDAAADGDAEQAGQTETTEEGIDGEEDSDETGSRSRRRRERRRQKLYEAERRAQEAERRAAELEAKFAAQQIIKPKIDDYATDEEYEQALLKYFEDSKAHEPQPAAHPDVQDRRQAHLVNNGLTESQAQDFLDSWEDAREKFKDFDAVMSSSAEQLADNTIRMVSSQDDVDSAELLYQLAKNPKVLQSLNGVSEIVAAQRLGRFIAHMESGKAQKPRKTTAPPPAPQLSGSTAGGDAVDYNKLSDEEFFARREQEIRARKRR